MDERKDSGIGGRGPRLGWTLGLVGGTLWMPVVAVVLLVHGDVPGGLLLLVLTAASVVAHQALRPWMRPDTPLWQLFLGTVSPVLAGAVVTIWRIMALAGQGGALFLPVVLVFLIPCLTLGRKTWRELHTPPQGGNGQES